MRKKWEQFFTDCVELHIMKINKYISSILLFLIAAEFYHDFGALTGTNYSIERADGAKFCWMFNIKFGALTGTMIEFYTSALFDDDMNGFYKLRRILLLINK